jgi:hypothetical protein
VFLFFSLVFFFYGNIHLSFQVLRARAGS